MPAHVTRRRLLRLGAGGAVALGVAGCGAPAAPPGTDLAATKADLQWMIAAHTPETQEWFAGSFIPAYQQQRPQVTVTMSYVTWDELFAKRGALFAAGSGPDVLQAGADDTVEYVRTGYTVNLRDRVARWKDWSDWYEVPKEATTYEGHVTGIPAQLRPRALHLRRDLFERRGVKHPTTWDEMRAAAVQLTERNGTEVTIAGYHPANWGYQQFFPMVWQAGGEMASPDLKQVLFSTAPVIEGLRFWMDLLNQIQPPGHTLAATPSGVPAIVHGTSAAQVEAQGPLDTAIKRIPEVVDKLLVRPPLKKDRALSFFSTNWFCLGSQCKVPDLTWDLLQFFFRPEHLIAYDKSTSVIAPRKSMRAMDFMADPRYQMEAWVEVVEKYARPHPPIVNIGEVNNLVPPILKDVREGKRSPKEGVEELARGMQQIFDDFTRR
jgi:ABC-type glycerol-3-phosphate transport system substrate-binding protein